MFFFGDNMYQYQVNERGNLPQLFVYTRRYNLRFIRKYIALRPELSQLALKLIDYPVTNIKLA